MIWYQTGYEDPTFISEFHSGRLSLQPKFYVILVFVLLPFDHYPPMKVKKVRGYSENTVS